MSQLETLLAADVTVLSIKQDTPDVTLGMSIRQTGITLGPKHYKNTRQLSKMRVLWCLNNCTHLSWSDAQRQQILMIFV